MAAAILAALASFSCGGGPDNVGGGGTSSTNQLTTQQLTVQFGNIPVGTTTQAQTLTFTNPSTSPSSVTINTVQLAGSGFSFVQTPTTPITVAAGQSTSVQVQALASSAGALNGTITVTSTATPSIVTINLTATGVAGQSQTVSGTITPAAQAVGSTVNVTNAGGTTVDTVTVDSSGNYQLFIFANGTYNVTPSATGLFFTPPTKPVTISVGSAAITGTNFTASTTAPVPAITSLSPNTVTAGSAPLTLTINGSNFLLTSTATYNGVSHAVTFKSATQLTIPLTSGDLATGGNFPVVVTNPGPGGGPSNAVNFVVTTVTNPVPMLSSVSPTTLAVGTAGPQTLTLNGSNFMASSTVTYNGVSHAATFVNSNQITISLNSADLQAAGSLPVIVTNPAPGGGVSSTVNFVVSGLSVSPSNLPFGSVDDGTSSASQTGTLTALGSGMTVNAPTVSGAGYAVVPSGFSFPVTLTAGQSVQFSVTFSPAAGSPGAVAGSAQFTSNVNTATQTFSGTGARNVLLSWTASPTGGVTYNVYRCSGSCGSPLTNYTQIKTGISALTYTDDDPALVSQTTYSYVVTAVLSGTESVPSNAASATVP
ncbi:MAG: choice-of-anchor D domain-containing protein [Acidobacteria bacterium]|nr:choice-of-anchor D domain-containing protein [Acidobacteriota bacterium]